MSENRSREGVDFSKYDAMTTQQLQELLRLDSEAPNNGAADTEEILYIMEVLAERKKDTFSDKKALESWESFQRDYLDAEDEEDVLPVISMPSKKASWVRRWAAVAAAAFLLISIPITAVALNAEKLWNTGLVWKDGQFSFQPEEPAIATKDNHEFQQALSDHGVAPSIVPSRIPERYFLEKVAVDEYTDINIYVATYANSEDTEEKLVIQVATFLPSDPGKHQANEGILEVYEVNGIEYYIVRNNKRLKALWLTGPYECVIAGEVTVEELKVMIDSIG